ncbi:MAG: YdiU family protein, partial [Chitinophagaceae bacterium]|nr:YdiU family protein [Chitinophagaceae bacterium]
MKLAINDTFNKELPIDPIQENYVRQVANACMSNVNPTACKNPKIIHTADQMLENLGLRKEDAQSQQFLNVFSGNEIYANTTPYAMCYGGHQFGNWAGQLGDGRAINLFEVNHNSKQWAVQLKGAGKTPYSRTADGLAVLRSSVREYLCSEAMHHLGVPTTRAVSLILSGDKVVRDVLYNGNPAYENGAIVCRVAPSFIRFGNFQILSVRNDLDNLKKLVDYTITHFYAQIGAINEIAYINFIKEVAERTMQTIIEWQRVGFVHGVMNTDNMSILGLTIDYGPYGWLEDYNPGWTPNTTDAGRARYAFGKQGYIALWNIYQLANALSPLIKDTKKLENVLQKIQDDYHSGRQKMMLGKIGLNEQTENAEALIKDLEQLLQHSEMDMTLFFRNLSSFDGIVSEVYISALAELSYSKTFDTHRKNWTAWFTTYSGSLGKHQVENKVEQMNLVNPKYVLRNYMAQLAIEAADKGDYSIIDEL